MSVGTGLAAAGAVALTTYLLSRARVTRPLVSRHGVRVLRYSRWLAALAGCCALMAVGLTVGIALQARPEDPSSIASDVAMGIFFLVAVGSALEFGLVRVELSEGSISSVSPWRGRRSVPWAAISSVSFSTGAMWFVIRAPGGSTIRAHVYLQGIAELALELRRRCPESVLVAAKPGFDLLGLPAKLPVARDRRKRGKRRHA